MTQGATKASIDARRNRAPALIGFLSVSSSSSQSATRRAGTHPLRASIAEPVCFIQCTIVLYDKAGHMRRARGEQSAVQYIVAPTGLAEMVVQRILVDCHLLAVHMYMVPFLHCERPYPRCTGVANVAFTSPCHLSVAVKTHPRGGMDGAHLRVYRPFLHGFRLPLLAGMVIGMSAQ